MKRGLVIWGAGCIAVSLLFFRELEVYTFSMAFPLLMKGWGTLEAVYYDVAYVIFPLWYALFAWIYLRQVGWGIMPGAINAEA